VCVRYNTCTKPIQNSHNGTDNTADNSSIRNKKWATFTCVGREVRMISKVFKHYDVNVVIKTSNTSGCSKNQILKNNKYHKSSKYQVS
jgi:hypothetical protein